MQDFSSTVSCSPSFSYYASGEFAAATVKVSCENQSYNIADHDADFEFETSPLHEETFVHFPTFTNVTDKKAADNKNISENFFGNCLWRPIRSPAASKIIKRSELSTSTPKRCLLKKFLTRSNSDGAVSSPSASKRCYFKDFMKRSHSDGGGVSKTSLPALNGKDKTASYKAREGDIRRKSYLPYRQDLIGVFAGIQRLRR